jgi:hypothetical protein
LSLPRNSGSPALIDGDPDRGIDASFEHFDSEVVYLGESGQQAHPAFIFESGPVDEAIL